MALQRECFKLLNGMAPSLLVLSPKICPMMIVAEYHSKGDLASYLLKKGRLSPSKALRFALDIARGINYLHECKPDPIIHCDLKP
ncbi:hypothetical protein OIU76_028793, partial [Salix suchowensis]